MGIKHIHLLDNTVSFKLPSDWKTNKKREDLLEVSFPFGSYPVLGINIKCIDEPKINSKDKIRNFLNSGLDNNNQIKILNEDIQYLECKINLESENLYLWKVLHYLKPRSFRLLTASLAWPNNKKANKLIEEIINHFPTILKSLEFSKELTIHDNLAVLEKKLKSLPLSVNKIWNNFKIKIPKRWKIIFNKGETAASINLEEEKFSLFFEKTTLELKIKLEEVDIQVSKLIEEMTKGLFLRDQSLKKSENNNYLYTFVVEEGVKKTNINTIFINNIWYRIKVKESSLTIISFVFSYDKKLSSKGQLYTNKIHELISDSEVS